MIPYETSLIKLLLSHTEWEEASKVGLSIQDFPRELQPFFSVVDNFHGGNADDLSVADLANLIFATVSKDHPYYQEVLSTIDKLDVSEQTSKILLNTIVRNRNLKEISLAAYEVTEGRTSLDKFNALLERYKGLGEASVEEEEDEFVTDDIESIVNEAFTHPGLSWRLSTLNRMMGSLRKGDFGFIVARPEVGKTSFLASEIPFMAEQLADNAGPIIWFANEEAGSKVMMRVYQGTFGIDLSSLLSNLPHWKAEYAKVTKNKIKILDRSVISKTVVEGLCRKHRPSLIVIDQLSKISGFDNDREDLRLGAICRWARELAKEYGPVIGVTQADGTGEGVKWLNMGHVANSKTAMQAEADFILGIGKQNTDGYENIRYLGLSKNKLAGDQGVTDPNLRHGHCEVLLEAAVARYKDLM